MEEGTGSGRKTTGVARGVSGPADWKRPVARDEPHPLEEAAVGLIDALVVFRRVCHLQHDEHAPTHLVRHVRQELLALLAEYPGPAHQPGDPIR